MFALCTHFPVVYSFDLESPDYDLSTGFFLFWLKSIHGVSKQYKSCLLSHRVEVEVHDHLFVQEMVLEAFSQQMKETVYAVGELVHAENLNLAIRHQPQKRKDKERVLPRPYCYDLCQ